ncbi:hypothetical protein [Streptomyces sp. NPDC050585]|uniref:hypothetical protein n=1 Tax=Streptomyces sp. NPDC050585 TaxID=3365632 RepID=UPI0037AAA913
MIATHFHGAPDPQTHPRPGHTNPAPTAPSPHRTHPDLTGTQLSDLGAALVNVADNNVNAPVTIQLLNLETAAINTYLQKFNIVVLPVKVGVCAGSICV